MTISVGDRLPDAHPRQGDRRRPRAGRSTDDFFAGRTVALFAVPGAFTPTCSAKHLPGFVEKADELKAKGIDEIACTSVNDAFVMGAWAQVGRRRRRSRCWPTATATSPRRSGSTMDGSQVRHGQARQRYSMIVNDGVVEQLNVEGPGEFKVSSAEHLLEQTVAARPRRLRRRLSLPLEQQARCAGTR